MIFLRFIPTNSLVSPGVIRGVKVQEGKLPQVPMGAAGVIAVFNILLCFTSAVQPVVYVAL